MGVRSRRVLSDSDLARLIEDLRNAHCAVIASMAKAPISSAAYGTLAELNRAICRAADDLSGVPDCLLSRQHKTPE
jgi:hypothetical protein